MAAKQDERQRMDEIKKQENYIMMRMQLGVAERNRDLKPEEELEGHVSKIMIQNTNVQEINSGFRYTPSPDPVKNAAVAARNTLKNKKNSKPMDIDIRNNKNEADVVGRETIDLINKEAENSDIAEHLNKTDRQGNLTMMTEGKSQDNLNPN